jgi:hypothetical protein
VVDYKFGRFFLFNFCLLETGKVNSSNILNVLTGTRFAGLFYPYKSVLHYKLLRRRQAFYAPLVMGFGYIACIFTKKISKVFTC